MDVCSEENQVIDVVDVLTVDIENLKLHIEICNDLNSDKPNLSRILQLVSKYDIRLNSTFRFDLVPYIKFYRDYSYGYQFYINNLVSHHQHKMFVHNGVLMLDDKYRQFVKNLMDTHLLDIILTLLEGELLKIKYTGKFHYRYPSTNL